MSQEDEISSRGHGNNLIDLDMDGDLDLDQEAVVEEVIPDDPDPTPPPEYKPTGAGLAIPVRKRKLTSNVWYHFDLLPVDKNNKQMCKCKKCGQLYNASSKHGTGNLKRHVESCIRNTNHDISQLLLQTSASGSLTSKSPKFNPEIFRELLTMAIVRHDLPFQFVEYECIRRLLRYVCPDVSFITRNTAKADALKLYKREKTRIKELLQKVPGRICLTSDCWTSVVTDGYVSLTAHFTDENWVLRKLLLNFSFMPPPHSGVSLTEKVYKLLGEWGIETKIMSITLDNASANDVFADLLSSQLAIKQPLVCNGDFFHVRCCAHVLNLIVQDGLKHVDDAVCKIRESIKYCKGSQSRKQRFHECVNLVSLEPTKGLRQDVPTRWNSTYLMLDSALYYKRAFVHLQMCDSNYKNCPTSDEWTKLEKIYNFLKVFYVTTCAFSGTKYPTSNLYFPNVAHVRLTLKEGLDSHDSFIKRMATQMYAKFEKYWSDFSQVMAMAIILDPRYKFQFVDFLYQKIYGADAYLEVSLVKDKLFSMYVEYVGACVDIHGSSINNLPTQEPSTQQAEDAEDLFLKEFDNYESTVVSAATKSELELYLEEPKVPRQTELNVLSYWKANQFRYPRLSQMARDILTIPISTVASEAAFSVGGRVLDQFRSTLKPNVVEAIVCTRDWLVGEQANMMITLDELCEDLMAMKLSTDANVATDDGNAPTSVQN